jgi:hypothetical protein
MNYEPFSSGNALSCLDILASKFSPTYNWCRLRGVLRIVNGLVNSLERVCVIHYKFMRVQRGDRGHGTMSAFSFLLR